MRHIKFIIILMLAAFSKVAFAHYCPQLTQNELRELNKAINAIKIERSELLDSVSYVFKAPKSANEIALTDLWLRFGFGKHPEGSIRLHYDEKENNEVIFFITSLSKGFVGCIDIMYGKECGLMPQIVVKYDKAYINEDFSNTVYCGFNPPRH